MALVKLTDMDPAVFAIVLEYLYSDRMDSLGDADAALNLAVDVIVAADLLTLPRLKQLCERAIASFLEQYGGPVESQVMADLVTLCSMHTCAQLNLFLTVYGELHPALDESSDSGSVRDFAFVGNPGTAAMAGEISRGGRPCCDPATLKVCASPISAGYLQGITQLWQACRRRVNL